jgi:hypothetical protein
MNIGEKIATLALKFQKLLISPSQKLTISIKTILIYADFKIVEENPKNGPLRILQGSFLVGNPTEYYRV